MTKSMDSNEGFQIARRRGLSAGERVEVEQLAVLCNRYEDLDLPFSYEPTSYTTDDETGLFLYYVDGTLAGFASLEGGRPPEAAGMVHPAHRRRGIGRALLAAVREECGRRGLRELILVCDEAAGSGKAFVEAVGAQYRYSEYRMLLDPSSVDRSRPGQNALSFREASAEEVEAIVRIMAAAFGDPEEMVRRFVERSCLEANQRFYIATVDMGEEGAKPVGTLRVSRHDPEVYITAFGILPAYQGRGFGRQMLGDAVDMLLGEKCEDIRIEVETENRNALGLYRSCGFRETTTYGYYHIDV